MNIANSKAQITKRQKAMQRYLKFAKQQVKFFKYENKNYLSNGYSLVETTEKVERIDGLVQTDDTQTISRLVNYANVEGITAHEINISKIISEAKKHGYKYKKAEIGNESGFTTLFHYKNAYYKIGILDQAFAIVNDNSVNEIYSEGSALSPLIITTSIGKCVILPIKMRKNIDFNGKFVIEY